DRAGRAGLGHLARRRGARRTRRRAARDGRARRRERPGSARPARAGAARRARDRRRPRPLSRPAAPPQRLGRAWPGRRRVSRSIAPGVLGEGNVAIVLSGGDAEPAFGQVERLVERAGLTIGSSGAILACGAARLGLRTAFAGVVGQDPFGDAFLAAL